MCFFPPFLQILQVLIELGETVVAVVLTRDIGADGAELLQLLFHILRGRLDVRSDSPNVLFVIHLSPGVTDDLDVFG